MGFWRIVGTVIGVLFLGWFVFHLGVYVLAFVATVVSAAIIAGLVWLGRRLPEVQWLTRAAIMILAVVIALVWLWPQLFGAFDRSYPRTSGALGRRQVESDIVAAEWTNPIALRARIGWVKYCAAMEQRQGEWIDAELEKLMRTPANDAETGLPVVDRERLKKLRAAQAQIEQDRLECRGLILKSRTNPSGGKSGGDWREPVADWFTASPRLVIWALVALGIAAVAAAVLFRQFSIIKGAVGVVLVVYAGYATNAWFDEKWTFFGASPKKTCVIDEDRPLRTVKKLEGRAPLWLLIPQDIAAYAISRHDDVPGDIVVWFRRGDVRDTWERGEPMPIDRWRGMLPERMFGEGHITLTVYPYRCT